MGENTTGLSASDVALLNDGGLGNNSFIWLFAILALMGGGFGGGWGNNNLANAIGYENLATSSEVQRGFDNQNLQAQTRDILAAVNSGTAQSVAATNQVFHDVVNNLGDKYSELARDIANVQMGVQQGIANQNACCCATKELIMQSNYDGAMRDAATNANFTAQIQSVKDMISENRMADMQSQINELQLQNAMSGVVRYPNAWTYNAGVSPFCGCNCGMM